MSFFCGYLLGQLLVVILRLDLNYTLLCLVKRESKKKERDEKRKKEVRKRVDY